MLALTASIAERLLQCKDMGKSVLDEQTKLDIIALAETAAMLPEDSDAPGVIENVIENAPDHGAAPQQQHGPEDDLASTPADESYCGTPVCVMVEPEPEPAQPVAISVENNDMQPLVAAEEAGSPAEMAAASGEPADLALWRQAFSINDLYLFRHELFRDSDTLFNQALAELGNARDPLEVRQILIDRYGIDPRRAPAKEFMAIISSFFQ